MANPCYRKKKEAKEDFSFLDCPLQTYSRTKNVSDDQEDSRSGYEQYFIDNAIEGIDSN